MATHRVTDDDHLPPAERVHHGHQVAREVLRPVGGCLGPVALAVTPLVEGDHVKPILERCSYLIEPVSVGRTSVEEAERGAAGGSPLQKVQRQGARVHAPAASALAAE